MKLETIYEKIRVAKSDAEVQMLEEMLDCIVADISAAQEALEEAEKWEREDSEKWDREEAEKWEREDSLAVLWTNMSIVGGL